MAINFEELVDFVGEEPLLVARVKKAVEWVFSKPEGREMLESAYRLHGEPLKIITDSTIHNLGYADHLGNHVVFANPLVNDVMVLNGQAGEKIPNTLERFFSHEFTHAAQPDVFAHGQAMIMEKQRIIAESMPQIPIEDYFHRLGAAKNNDAALQQVFGEVYDTHIAPHAQQMNQTMMDNLSQGQAIQKFAKEYETPAIEFENMMMGKYRGEPGRTTDYTKSGDYDEMLKSMDRKGFIDSAMQGFRASVPAQAISEETHAGPISARVRSTQGDKPLS